MEERDGVLYVKNVVPPPPAPAPPVVATLAATGPVPVREAQAPARPRPTSPYSALIRETAARYALAPELVESVIQVESNFEPRAVSPKGARGLMQLMPGTAALLGVRNSFDVRQNIEGGVRYLRYLADRFRGDLLLALAAYNAGPEAVTRYGGIPPFAETQAYVAKVARLLERSGMPLTVAVAEAAPPALAPLSTPGPQPAAPPPPDPPETLHRYETSDGRSVYSNLAPERLPPSMRAMLGGEQ